MGYMTLKKIWQDFKKNPIKTVFLLFVLFIVLLLIKLLVNTTESTSQSNIAIGNIGDVSQNIAINEYPSIVFSYKTIKLNEKQLDNSYLSGFLFEYHSIPGIPLPTVGAHAKLKCWQDDPLRRSLIPGDNGSEELANVKYYCSSTEPIRDDGDLFLIQQ